MISTQFIPVMRPFTSPQTRTVNCIRLLKIKNKWALSQGLRGKCSTPFTELIFFLFGSVIVDFALNYWHSRTENAITNVSVMGNYTFSIPISENNEIKMHLEKN